MLHSDGQLQLLTQISFHFAVDGRFDVNRQIECNWVVAHVDAKLPHELLKVVEDGTLHVDGKDKVGIVRIEANLAMLNVNFFHLTAVHVNVTSSKGFSKVVRENHRVVRSTFFH